MPHKTAAGTHHDITTRALQAGLNRGGLSSEGHSGGHFARIGQGGSELKGQNSACRHAWEQWLQQREWQQRSFLSEQYTSPRQSQ